MKLRLPGARYRERQEHLIRLLEEAVSASKAATVQSEDVMREMKEARRPHFPSASTDPPQAYFAQMYLLSIAVVVLLVLAARLAVLGAAAFNAPEPYMSDSGSAMFGIDTGPENPVETTTGSFKVGTAVEYRPSEHTLDYEFVFPVALLNKEFRLTLSDSAILRNVKEISGSPTVSPTFKCFKHSRCQTISGILRGVFADSTSGFDNSGDPTCASKEWRSLKDVQTLEIWGTTGVDIDEKLDWAHEVSRIPNPSVYSGESPFSYATGSDVDSVDYPQQIGCGNVFLPEGRKLSDSNVPPLQASPGEVSFDAGQAVSFTLITKPRNADTMANIYIAGAGLIGGLAVGLVPTVYEVGREWRRARRRERRIRQFGLFAALRTRLTSRGKP